MSKIPYELFAEEIDRKWPELRDISGSYNNKVYANLSSPDAIRFHGHIRLKETGVSDRQTITDVVDHLKSLGYVPDFDGTKGVDKYPHSLYRIPVGSFKTTTTVENQEEIAFSGRLSDEITLSF